MFKTALRRKYLCVHTYIYIFFKNFVFFIPGVEIISLFALIPSRQGCRNKAPRKAGEEGDGNLSDNREVLHVLLRNRQSLIMRYVVRSQGELRRADVIFFDI